MRWSLACSLVAFLGCAAGLSTPTYVDLYDRERALCVGVPEGGNPLESLPVAAARPIAEFGGRPRLHRTRGARLFIPSRAGWTAARLQRWSDCHVARMALLMPEERASHDPLAVEGVEVEVRAAGRGWELWITADRHRGIEVHRRAAALVAD